MNTRVLGSPASRRVRAIALGLLSLLGAGACARPVLVAPPVSPGLGAPAVGSEETGRASWYGVPHHGRPTASGEIYDMYDLTAAHPSLPLGTRLLVTNLDSGRAVELRVNDRGPFVQGRILDLSYAAARVLDAVGPGVIPVRLRVVALPDGQPGTAAGAATSGRFTVQVGAFTSRENAERLREALLGQASEVRVEEARVGGESYYRVRVGSYSDRAGAEEAARRLATRGHPALVVER